MTKNSIANILIPFTVGIVLSLFIIYPIKEPVIDPIYEIREKELLDSISLLKNTITLIHHKEDSLQLQYDSLKQIPAKIKYRTIEKIKVINSSTDVNQLDSIIRANW